MSSEDFLIFFSLSSSVSAAVAADRRDAAIMAELSDPALCRATLAPVTLACIGLDAGEFRQIARELAREQNERRRRVEAAIVMEYGPEDFEQVTLETCEERDPDSYEHLPSDSWAGGFADNH